MIGAARAPARRRADRQCRSRIGNRLLRLFVELNRLGTSVIIATHDYGLMEQLDAPRLVLYDGHLQIRRTP